VVAARAVARPRTDASEAALGNLAAGRRPDGSSAPSPIGDRHADMVVLAGHEDPEASMQAAAGLFAAAGRSVAVVAPEGCCGALARAVGDTDLADGLAEGLADLVGDARTVVAMDPHCLDELRAALPDVTVIDVVTSLAQDLDRLSFRQAGRPIVWHDPCVLARVEGVVDAPRRLLAAAGFTVVEPEHHGTQTACSGAGLAMPLLDPTAAAATAGQRADQLAETGADAVTSCHRAGALLTSAGLRTADLLQLLADLLEDD
jgi:Fe-S oxidoreductase